MAYHDLDGLQDNLSQERKELVANFLSTELKKLINTEPVRVRDLACANLALSILGDTTLKEESVQRLISISHNNGGWAEFSGGEQPCLVQSYFALLCLQRLGEKIDPKHSTWLSLLQKENHLCSFWQDDIETKFGSSSLVLYLATILGNSDKDWVHSLAQKINDGLKQVFIKMQSNDNSWISYDPHSSFTILGYGHAISALNYMRFNLFDSSLSDFLTSIEIAISSENIPAYREAAMAMRAIRLNYDPFQYFKSATKEIKSNIEHSMELKRQTLVQTSEKLQLYQKIIDAWEMELKKQQHELPQLMISSFLNFFRERRKKFLISFAYYFGLVTIFIIPILIIIEKIFSRTFSTESNFILLISIIPVVIELFRWRRKSKGKPKV